MPNLILNTTSSILRYVLLAAGIAMLLLIAACQKEVAGSAQTSAATFATPEEAGKALAVAARSQDKKEILQIFGASSADFLSSGDPVEDKASLSGFVAAYQTMSRWRKLNDGSELLLVGAENQAFPIPLKRNATGRWYFDADGGRSEIIARRIGYNEITVIGACSALVDAQNEYFSQKHNGVKQYAEKFISDPGQQNGLYWDSPGSSNRSPLGPLIAYATSEGYKVHPNQHEPFNGYYFAMLDKQGPQAQGGAKDYIENGRMTRGFAVVAYPARYGDSGIMTFIVSKDGIAFQKDLGNATSEVVSGITEFNPDQTWTDIE